MDPYLETADLWPLFQHTFVNCLYQILLPGLPDRYRARIVQRHYGAQGEQCENYVEILLRSDERLVTLVEVVSPSNKTTAAGQEACFDTWRPAKAAGASLVEIDLVLQGAPLFESSRDGLLPWDYAVTVKRASHPERYEIYTTTLQKRLPRIKIPLAADDRDTVMDLQATFRRCYDHANFDERINYENAPECLHDRIAVRAYGLWEQEGCPHGRDREHWQMALEQLRSPAGMA